MSHGNIIPVPYYNQMTHQDMMNQMEIVDEPRCLIQGQDGKCFKYAKAHDEEDTGYEPSRANVGYEAV